MSSSRYPRRADALRGCFTYTLLICAWLVCLALFLGLTIGTILLIKWAVKVVVF